MSKRIFKMVVPIQSKLGLKKNTKNIYKFINRVPCDAQQYNKPLQSVNYVDQQMTEYPIPKRVLMNEPTTRESILKDKVRSNYMSNKETRLLKLALKLERKITYLELQELRALLPEFNRKQTKKHQKQLKMVSYKINYTILRNQIKEQFVLDEAKKVINQITEKLNSKVNQLY